MCIRDSNGTMPLKQLAPLLYKIFGVESKDCYRFYTDIKHRKNESSTYFPVSYTHLSMLCRFKVTYPAERIDSVRSLLEDKERQMFQIVRLMDCLLYTSRCV